MKRKGVIKQKGDGKGSLKTRKLKMILCDEEHTLTVRPYAVRITPAKPPKGARKRD